MPISIWAPHGDDEIIGCYSVLRKCKEDAVVPTVYFGEIDDGCARSSSVFQFRFLKFDLSLETADKITWDTVYAPDPQYDNHPRHQLYGSIAQMAFREGRIKKLRLYNTTMLSPYIMELDTWNKEGKREALNHCYPGKSSLWQFDHRYFLFEGNVEWLHLA